MSQCQGTMELEGRSWGSYSIPTQVSGWHWEIPEDLDRSFSSGTPRNAICRELFLAFNFDIFQKFPCTKAALQ